ncbi:MAG: hypothetical protein Q7P63_04875 [Verrucomicrobiota bacterium JB022]|nr:hypothetical protein [Verrucomicrobiota bacterium JB022]
MSTLQVVIEELKALPPAQQQEAAQFIHALKGAATVKKQSVLERTSGCLSAEEAKEWLAAIDECSQIDHDGW